MFRLRGYYPPYKFRAALQYVTEGFYKEETFKEYLERAEPGIFFMLAGLNERRREMAILRATGARPVHIFTLLIAEATFLGLIGAILGAVLIQLIFAIAAPILAAQYGVALIGTGPGLVDLYTIGAVTLAALFLGIWPAMTALRRSLADGLTVKV